MAPFGTADADRCDPDVRRAVQTAMPRICNRMIREATTEYVWIVEDDVIPPLDAAERLLHGFDDQTASVSGAFTAVGFDQAGSRGTRTGLSSSTWERGSARSVGTGSAA